MVLCDVPPPVPARRRGRPVGSDSAETRNRILMASRRVINERGYHAATFQAIAVAAGVSRPTLHYYFSSREEVFRVLVDEANAVMARCVAAARQLDTLAEQFAAFAAVLQESDFDRSQIAFLVNAQLEFTRNPELRAYPGLELSDFLVTLVVDAKRRGHLPADCAVEPVADMLRAMLWGIGFYAGFVDDVVDPCLIAKQLGGLFSYGLLGGPNASLTPDDTGDDTPSPVGGRS